MRTRTFQSKAIFSKEVEKLMRKDTNLTYAEAILEYASSIGVELETAAKLLTKEFKDKMEIEATRLHLLNKDK